MVLINDKELKPVTLYKADGSSETVYVEKEKPSARDHIILTYMVVGIVSFGLTAFLTYRQLNK